MAAVGAKHLVGGRDLTVEVAKAKKKRLALDMDSICSFCCFVSIIILQNIGIYIYNTDMMCIYMHIYTSYTYYIYM